MLRLRVFLATQACTILGIFVPAGTDFGVKLLSNDKGKIFHSSLKPSFVTFGIEIPDKGQVLANHHGLTMSPSSPLSMDLRWNEAVDTGLTIQ